ncbi:4609_t:CDS:2 [Scutellospora calospora]|uniref:4609_t:CDS:1 n=1 Tax=Scutellospora calospora TaxID=85575 RepID=A0ACA9KWM2_9GLOM|nr:4609_t:CDS:2 [Scutellospora calospora]
MDLLPNVQKSLRDSKLECGERSSIIPTINYCSTTLVVKNDGTLERNFLSWLRTSTALILTGLSLCFRFRLIPQSTVTPIYENPNPLGILLIFTGLFVLLWSIINYFRFQKMLEKKIAIVENGKFNFFVITFIGSLIFMSLFTSIMYVNNAKENTNDEIENDGLMGFL